MAHDGDTMTCALCGTVAHLLQLCEAGHEDLLVCSTCVDILHTQREDAYVDQDG